MVVQCPPAGHSIWDAFNAMGHPAHDAGFVYLTQQEIAAYCTNYRVRFTPFELDMIRTLDRLAATVSARYQPAKK